MSGTPLKGALVGCGFFAHNQMQAWADIGDAEIVALCDTNADNLDAFSRDYAIDRCYRDMAALLEEESLDFVDVATTVGSHRVLVEQAAAAGVPVVCQKPVAETLTDARAMVEACERAAVPFMVHENFRWQAPIRALVEAVREGRIGQPFFARVSFRSGFDVYSLQPYLATDERFIIQDLGIHLLDVTRVLLGEVTRLACETARVNPKIAGEDTATLLMTHEDGARSVVDCSYATRPAREPFPQSLIEVDGDQGTARLGLDYKLRIHNAEGTEDCVVAPAAPPWTSEPWRLIQESVVRIQRHWVECLRGGREPETSGRDNFRTLALVEAAYESAQRHVIVTPETL